MRLSRRQLLACGALLPRVLRGQQNTPRRRNCLGHHPGNRTPVSASFYPAPPRATTPAGVGFRDSLPPSRMTPISARNSSKPGCEKPSRWRLTRTATSSG